MSQVSGLSCKKRKVDEAKVHLMKELSDTDNDTKKLLTESEFEDSLYCRSSVPCWRWVRWKRNDLLKLELVNFYMNYNLTKNVTKIKKYHMLEGFLASPSEAVRRRCSYKKISANMRQIYRTMHMQKCDFMKDILQIY